MEFHELVENETFRAAIGPEKLAAYASWIDFNRWHGFYVWDWTDTSERGVSDDLDNLFGIYPFENWSACEGEIRSEKLSVETLKKIALKLLPDEDDEIRINGGLFKRQAGELLEVSK